MSETGSANDGGRGVRGDTKELLEKKGENELWRLCGHCEMKLLLLEKKGGR